MKALKITLLLLITATFTQAQDVLVKGNTKLNTDFSKYKTFTWAKLDETVQPEAGYYIYTYTEEHALPVKQQKTTTKNGKTVKTTTTVTTTTPYTYSYNVIIPSSNALVNTAVRSALQDELEARGYRQNDAGADLLVSYRVLERRAKIKGYINDTPTLVGSTEVRQPSDTTTHILEPGTLLISLIDIKTSEVLWDGFASGLIRDNLFITDETRIKEAVHLIMEEFKYRGDRINKVN